MGVKMAKTKRKQKKNKASKKTQTTQSSKKSAPPLSVLMVRTFTLVLLVICFNWGSATLYTQENIPNSLQARLEKERERLNQSAQNNNSKFNSDDTRLDHRTQNSSPFDRSKKRFENSRHRFTTSKNALSTLRNRQNRHFPSYNNSTRFPSSTRGSRQRNLNSRSPRNSASQRSTHQNSPHLRNGERSIANAPRLPRGKGNIGSQFSPREYDPNSSEQYHREVESIKPGPNQEESYERDSFLNYYEDYPRSPLPPLEPSEFERQLESYIDPDTDRPITQFGYEVFRRPQADPLDIPVGDNYILGVGDRIVLTVWGNLDADFEGTIGRDGQVRLPQIGPMSLKGNTLANAEEKMRKAFKKFHTNFELQLSLGRLRDMPVHVIGRASAPGRARLSSVSTLFDALTNVGGVTKDGSLRSILVRRDGQADRKVDLYDYLLEGKVDGDLSLRTNDVIVIPPVGSRVAIIGSVLRPSIYELEFSETSLDELLKMAGGFARLADRRDIQIERTTLNGISLSSVDLTRAQASDIKVDDGDVVIVRNSSPRVENVVYIDGNVSQPGRYAFRPGMRVSDLITQERLVEAGFWLDRLSPEVLDAELDLPEPYMDYALIRRIHPQTHQESRVPFDLQAAIFDNDLKENHLLKPQDTIIIFPRSEFDPPHAVYVTGAVNKPGRLDFYEGMRILDLIRMSGNLIPEAHHSSAVLTRIHPDQDGAHSEHIHLDIKQVFENHPEANLVLQPEDSLVIKSVPNYKKPFKMKIEGEVVQPGDYWVIPGERLSDVLTRAGGFTSEAYLPAARFFKESIKKLQLQRMEESLRRLEVESKIAAQQYAADVIAIQNISQRPGTSSAQAEAERIDSLIKTIRATPPEGRMVLKIKPADELRGTPDDILLEENDILVVPRKPEEINVIGAVFNQTALLHRSDKTVQEYIDECGGPTVSADVERIFVIRADGSADSVQNFNQGFHWDSKKGRFSLGGLLKSNLHPGDTVVIPFDVEPKLSKLGLTSAVSQILFQAAMATGVVIALL